MGPLARRASAVAVVDDQDERTKAKLRQLLTMLLDGMGDVRDLQIRTALTMARGLRPLIENQINALSSEHLEALRAFGRELAD